MLHHWPRQVKQYYLNINIHTLFFKFSLSISKGDACIFQACCMSRCLNFLKISLTNEILIFMSKSNQFLLCTIAGVYFSQSRWVLLLDLLPSFIIIVSFILVSKERVMMVNWLKVIIQWGYLQGKREPSAIRALAEVVYIQYHASCSWISKINWYSIYLIKISLYHFNTRNFIL